jgi:Uma2 family endonuclease
MGTTGNTLPISFEQLLAFEPPSGYRTELLDGEIIVSPNPKPLYQEVAMNAFRLLEDVLRGQFAVRMRTHFRFEDRHSMPSPDVFVLSHGEWRQVIEEDRYPSRAPILAVEVISPANTEEHVRQKASLYREEGAVQVWTVFPDERKVMVCEQRHQQSFLEGSILRLPYPLPPFALNTAAFFLLC